MRDRLPERRQNATREVAFGGSSYTICIGYDARGEAREVFADGHKEGSLMQAFVDDACIVISLALQHGIARDHLAHSLTTVPAWRDGEETEDWGSPIGAIVALLEPHPELARLSGDHGGPG